LNCRETRKWTEEFLSRKRLNVKEGWLARKYYAVLTSIIYGSRKTDNLNLSGSKKEGVNKVKEEGNTIVTDREES
jgi:hypothetical protein